MWSSCCGASGISAPPRPPSSLYNRLRPILIPGRTEPSYCGALCPDRAQIRRSRRFARTALIRTHAIGATIGFAKNRTAIALADHPLPVSATTAAELATARLDGDDLESVPG